MFKNLSKGIRILFVSQVMFLAYMSAVIVGSAMKRIEIAEVIFKNPLSGMTGTLGPGIFIMIWGVVMGMAGFILAVWGLHFCARDDGRFKSLLGASLIELFALLGAHIGGGPGLAAKVVCSLMELVIGAGSILWICENLNRAGYDQLAEKGKPLITVYLILFFCENAVTVLGVVGIHRGPILGFIGLSVLALCIYYFFGYLSFLSSTVKALE